MSGECDGRTGVYETPRPGSIPGLDTTMKEKELCKALDERRESLKMSFKDLQRRTGLGYNTIRRIFKQPFGVALEKVLVVHETMGCSLMFGIERDIPDEIESGKQPPAEEILEELKQREENDTITQKTQE